MSSLIIEDYFMSDVFKEVDFILSLFLKKTKKQNPRKTEKKRKQNKTKKPPQKTKNKVKQYS